MTTVSRTYHLFQHTPECDNNNSNIQDIPSAFSDTVSPQQTPVILKSLNKSYSDLHSQSIAIKKFLLNEICILRKELYTNKDRMEHFISSLQDKNEITELTVKVSVIEEENQKLRNQIIENHITIGEMQNVSSTGKDSQAKPAELNMTKLVDNGEILTLDNESMSNESLSKKPICSKSIEEQMIEFRKKIMKNICDIKVIQRKHTTKMNPFFHQSVLLKLI